MVITGSIKSAACYGSRGGNRRPAIVSFRGRYLAQRQTEGSQKGGASHLCVLYLWRTSGEMGKKTSDLQDNFLTLDLDLDSRILQEDFVTYFVLFHSQTK